MTERHTPLARKVAKIIINEKKTIPTAWGRKSEMGIASLVDVTAGLKQSLNALKKARDFISNYSGKTSSKVLEILDDAITNIEKE